MIYEKYRTVYELDGVLVTLDEIPYGNFIEIEGPDGSGIKRLSLKLGLRWGARITDSYASLFQIVCEKLDVKLDNLVFSNFKDIAVLPIHLGVHRADGRPNEMS
jgi:adenylate cyclase class 2